MSFSEKAPAHSLSLIPGLDGRHLGALLLDMGKLLPEDAERILRLQRETGLQFGAAAIKLGLITEADVQQALARQYRYAVVAPGQSGISQDLVAAYKPMGPKVEALRAVRGQLLLRWFAGDVMQKTLAIVSPNRKEGRSYVAANLAVLFAQLGERTLLVDADLRNPTQHKLFGLRSSFGLSGLLVGRVGADAAIQRIEALPDLSVLPAGAVPPNPTELVTRSPFLEELASAAEKFDVILVDTPAAKLGPDAEMISARCQGAMIVARANATRVADVTTLRDRLLASNVFVVGSLLNA